MVNTTRRAIRTRLLDDYIPSKFTVLCGRGKEYTSSTGNCHLKSLVLKNLPGYSEAKSKVGKSSIVSEIMGEMKSLCPGPAFVKKENDAWWEVDDAFAREKIGKLCVLYLYYASLKKATVLTLWFSDSVQDAFFVTPFTPSIDQVQRPSSQERRPNIRPFLIPEQVLTYAYHHHLQLEWM